MSRGMEFCMKCEHQPTTERGKRRRLFVQRQGVIAAAVLSCVLFAPPQSHAESSSKQDQRVMLELSALGKRGDTIALVREQVLEILEQGNGCSAWFQEADPDAADVFRSLRFELEEKGPSYVYGKRDGKRGQLFKQPWAARSYEYGGRNSVVQLNANGAFFSRISLIMQLDAGGVLSRPGDTRVLTVSSYEGNTTGAQITILLHELGHIIGRLPVDNDSWDGRSSRNSFAVSMHCKAETYAATHTSSRGGN
jgi:hypothetical protein